MRFVGTLLLLAVVATAAVAQQVSGPRVVEIRSSEGTILKGTYFTAAQPGPGVILFHQSNRTRQSWEAIATQLATNGIYTLTVDARGHGESVGNTKDWKTWWPHDLEAVFEFLASQPGVRSDVIGFGGAGVSGVEDAVETARRHPAVVKSLVLLSGETDRPGLEFLHQAWRLPGLYVTADLDEYPPTQEAMQLLYTTASSSSKKLIHYPAAHEAPWLWYEPFDIGKVPATGNHGTDLLQTHAELPGTIVDWFLTTLVRSPGHAPADPIAAANVLNQLQVPGGAAEVRQQLTRVRTQDPQAQLFPEISASTVGQDFMRADDRKNAIEVLKLVALAYQDSADAHENLSEAYLADGQRELARQHAQTALNILNRPNAAASSWTNTEQYRGEIRRGAQKVLDQLK